MLITEIVLTGSLRPSSLAICAATWSKHSHLLFRLDNGMVIDSTFAHGGVVVHDEEPGPRQWEFSLPVEKHFTALEIQIMTDRALRCIGREYDAEGIVYGYLPNRPTSDWERRLWCFEFGRIVVEGMLPFDHRPDRAVGRHWLEALRGIAQ